jgi:hypothetical protein
VVHPATVPRGIAAWLRAALLWLSTPDDLVGWVPFAVWGAWRETRRARIDALLSSGPPFSVVLAGVLAKAVTGVPLLLDFRDAWTLDPVDPFGCIGGPIQAPRLPAREAVLRGMERWSLGRADRVAFTSDYTCAAYLREYPKLIDRASVLYNGVEEVDFDLPPDESVSGDFVYLGTLHEYQLPQALLTIEAFAAALRSEPQLQGACLRFMGHRSSRVDAALAARAAAHGAADRVRLEGAKPHRRAMAILRGARVLPLFAGQSRFTRLSKVSECLAAGRPVLALAAADSETAAHVGAAGQSFYAGSSGSELAEVLRHLWCERRPLGAPFPFPQTHAFHWHSTVRGFALELDELARAGGAAHARA